MATPRSSRSSSSASTPAPAPATPSRQKRRRVPEKKGHAQTRTHSHRHRSSSYARSVVAVAQCVAKIKRKLLREAAACEIIDDFFEGITSEPAFTFEFYQGPRWLHDAIARSCEAIFDQKLGQSTVYLVEVPEHDMVHGSILVDDYMGTVVFFEDIQLGAIALFPHDLSRPPHYIRLVMVEEPRSARDAPN